MFVMIGEVSAVDPYSFDMDPEPDPDMTLDPDPRTTKSVIIPYRNRLLNTELR